VRAVIQRVSSASVSVDGRVVGACGLGLLALVAAHKEDTEMEAVKLASKIATLRIFNDADDKINLSLGDVGGAVLAVSNFTVYGNTEGQRRPSFVAAAGFDRGQELFDLFVAALRQLGVPVQTGIFGAHMDVSLVNHGPVTIVMEA
jgi:D-aminoacyl-tRNA deacylase